MAKNTSDGKNDSISVNYIPPLFVEQDLLHL